MSNLKKEDVPAPAERMTAAFAKLSESTKKHSEAVGEYAKPIASVERALHRLEPGVECWTRFNGDQDENCYWRQDVGYTRFKGNWCLAIRTLSGSLYEGAESDDVDEMWAFNEAPVYLRIKALEALPALIEALVEATDASTKRLKAKVAPAEELAAAVKTFVFGPKQK